MAKRRMTTHKPKSVRIDRARKPAGGITFNWPLWGAVLLTTIIAGIPFCYGKYLEFNADDPYDGSLNVYSAKCVVDGQKLNVDVFPSARPATLLVNIVGVRLFGFSEFGPEFIQMLMQLAALVLMFYTLYKVYGPISAGLAVILAAFYLSCPPFAKYGNVKEQFMIACMIISACSLMLGQIGHKRWWITAAGAFAINTYYFKPTGMSVVIAMAVYLIAQPLMRERSWRQAGCDIIRLFIGGAVGLIPLAIFYLWQGQFMSFIGRFPAALVVLVIAVYLVSLAIRTVIVRGYYKYMNPRLAIVLAGSVVIVLFGTSIYFAVRGELLWFISDLPIVKYPLELIGKIHDVFRQVGKMIGGGSYVAGSREVTDFSALVSTVAGYYHSFVVPIGFGLLAVIWRIARVKTNWLARRKLKESQDNRGEATQADSFAVFLGLWWLLDMAFVWISPRSYVQYYLPLNGSAAMLAGYVIYRCGKNHLGFVFLLSAWLAADFLLVAINPSRQMSYGSFFLRVIPLVPAIAFYWLIKADNLIVLRKMLLILICFVMMAWWNSGVGGNFGKYKARGVQLANINRWHSIGHYIRDNSDTEDGLYVWGWWPGIYVKSQRICPAKKPSYSDMHSDQPDVVAGKITGTLRQLQEKPPKFIVDSQKIHFPHDQHPTFDLWPFWVKKAGKFYLKCFKNQKAEGKIRLKPDELDKYKQLYLDQVEKITLFVLTHPERRGGPMEKGRAVKRSQQERARHEAMLPLRKFVMENYKYVGRIGQMYIFRRKDAK